MSAVFEEAKINTAVDQRVASPCIGVCSTGIGDSVCRGCKRFMHEIIHWNGYSESEKRAVKNRLDLLLAQVIASKIEIRDADLLRKQLELQKIRFDVFSRPSSWVFELLRAGAKQIGSLDEFGCTVLPAFSDMSLMELKDDIDHDFYVLSTVHYERYFQ